MNHETGLTFDGRLQSAVRNYWGFEYLFPLQREAMECVLAGRDSVVVLPTGGGKSLCFQAPAMCLDGLAIVVSPLISLMKDQVDALRGCGVPAACINSSLSLSERRGVAQDIRAGRLRLLYVAPERLVQQQTLEFLGSVRVSLVAIDEAHCISQWGHDFRPEYRELRVLKEAFPGVGIHAYTATATELVREDIARNLGLKNPEILVGRFDRPNLVYRVARRDDVLRQIHDVVQRHESESGIVYCISRKDVDRTAAELSELGYRALPYHAGMEDIDRKRNQEAFIEERVEIIVATVAFGMGIDKPNVRYVVHAGMPKSLEHYQQESGRAGRDGLEADCVLIYSGGDFHTWRKIIDKSEPEAREGALRSLGAIYDFCTSVECRHRALSAHFGQELLPRSGTAVEKGTGTGREDGCEREGSDGAAGASPLFDSCGACDVCLGQLDTVEDALVIGQKILSSIHRQGQCFGGEYTVLVLKGSREKRILDNGHDRLSTHGLLADVEKRTIRDWIEQLAGQGFLAKTGEFQVLEITPLGRRLLKGEVTPRLLKPAEPTKTAREKATREHPSAFVGSQEEGHGRDGGGAAGRHGKSEFVDSWDEVDRGLFDDLRALRRDLAEAQGVPPYIIFGDTALRDMARRRPTNVAVFHQVRGVGAKKLEDYGEKFVGRIAAYCREHGLPTDRRPGVDYTEQTASDETVVVPRANARASFELFREGLAVEEVARRLGRAVSTTTGYLLDFIQHENVRDASPWVEAGTIQRIEQAAARDDTGRLKPIFEALGGTVSYDEIRIALACQRNRERERQEVGAEERGS